MLKTIAITITAIALALSLSGCEDVKCESGHNQVISTISNGKPSTMVLFVCDVQ